MNRFIYHYTVEKMITQFVLSYAFFFIHLKVMLVCLFSLSWLLVYFRYNDVLVNGLPTWRQPIYYYRKVRKFGFAESAVVLIIIASIIHYAMLWAAYWEKCYEIVSIRNHQQDKSSVGINLKRCTLYLSFI